MRRSAPFLLAAAYFSLFSAVCEARGSDDPWLTDVDLRVIGLDVGLGYRGIQASPNVDTILWTYLGGGYEWVEFYREPSGALMAPGALAGRNAVYGRVEVLGKVGIAQGLAWNETTRRNLLEAFLFYKTRYDWNQVSGSETISGSSLADRSGFFQNTILGGFSLDDVTDNEYHKSRSGVSAELSAEWGPSFFFNTFVGDSDFIRFNLGVKAFLPLFDAAPDRPVNLFCGYLADFFSVDYAVGFSAPVPLVIRQTFGGRNPQAGLGYAVRGVSWGSYDTNLKAVNNLELRFELPALYIPDLVPGIIVFLDSGFYDQVGEAGIPAPAPMGIVASTGIGISLDVLDLVTGVGYVDYRIDSENPNGGRWSLTVEASLHF